MPVPMTTGIIVDWPIGCAWAAPDPDPTPGPGHAAAAEEEVNDEAATS